MATTDQTEQRKLELVAQLADSRKSVLGAKLLIDEQIAEKKSAVCKFLNLPKLIKRSFTEKPVKSFGLALLSGLGASFVLKKKTKRKSQPKAEKRSVVSSFTLAIAGPILKKLALQYSQQWLAQRAKSKFAERQRLHES